MAAKKIKKRKKTKSISNIANLKKIKVILNYLAKKEEWKIELINESWNQSYDDLRSGKLDILGPIAFTEQRNQIFDFTYEKKLWAEVEPAWAWRSCGVQFKITKITLTLKVKKGKAPQLNYFSGDKENCQEY